MTLSHERVGSPVTVDLVSPTRLRGLENPRLSLLSVEPLGMNQTESNSSLETGSTFDRTIGTLRRATSSGSSLRGEQDHTEVRKTEPPVDSVPGPATARHSHDTQGRGSVNQFLITKSTACTEFLQEPGTFIKRQVQSLLQHQPQSSGRQHEAPSPAPRSPLPGPVCWVRIYSKSKKSSKLPLEYGCLYSVLVPCRHETDWHLFRAPSTMLQEVVKEGKHTVGTNAESETAPFNTPSKI
nr:PREDICTED: uncharacterized protein LOC109553285 [Bos indicus]